MSFGVKSLGQVSQDLRELGFRLGRTVLPPLLHFGLQVVPIQGALGIKGYPTWAHGLFGFWPERESYTGKWGTV